MSWAFGGQLLKPRQKYPIKQSLVKETDTSTHCTIKECVNILIKRLIWNWQYGQGYHPVPAYVLNCQVQIAPASLTDVFSMGNHNPALTMDNIYVYTWIGNGSIKLCVTEKQSL